MNDGTNTLEAQAHVADSRLRRKRAWRLFWGVIAAFGLLIVSVPLVFYVSWQAYGRSLLQAELDAIKAKGEPLTTADLNARYAAQKGNNDNTQAWRAAIAPFESTPAITNPMNLPIMGTAKLPALDQPWPDEVAIKEYFQAYDRHFEVLHAVGKAGGTIHPPRDFSRGYGGVDLAYVQSLRATARALMLDLQRQLRDKNGPATLRNLETQFALNHAIGHDPYLTAYLVRVALSGIAFDSVRQAVNAVPLSDEQLAHLQKLVRRADNQTQLREALLAERGLTFRSFHLPVPLLTGEIDPKRDAEELHTHAEVYGVLRPADCAMALHIAGRFIEDLDAGDANALLDSATDLNGELSQFQDHTGWIPNKLRYIQTMQTVASPTAIAGSNARFLAQRDLTDCVLAIRRFQLRHGRLPVAIAELVPDYLPEVPLDPFDGKPLRYQASPERTVVYSIHYDRVDNGGGQDISMGTADLIWEYKAPAP